MKVQYAASGLRHPANNGAQATCRRHLRLVPELPDATVCDECGPAFDNSWMELPLVVADRLRDYYQDHYWPSDASGYDNDLQFAALADQCTMLLDIVAQVYEKMLTLPIATDTAEYEHDELDAELRQQRRNLRALLKRLLQHQTRGAKRPQDGQRRHA